MSLVLPKVLTSTQNKDQMNGCLNGVRQPGEHCALCPSFESTHGQQTPRCVGLFQTHKRRTRKMCSQTQMFLLPGECWIVFLFKMI